MNILVLDDAIEQHAYYQHVIKHVKGVGTITMASNAEEFQERLGRCKQHVIICDIHMPNTSGPDILRQHKEQLAGSNIIMLSCADNINLEADALSRDGFNIIGIFQKPLIPQDLCDLLDAE